MLMDLELSRLFDELLQAANLALGGRLTQFAALLFILFEVFVLFVFVVFEVPEVVASLLDIVSAQEAAVA